MKQDKFAAKRRSLNHFNDLKGIENGINVILIFFRWNRIKTFASPWRQIVKKMYGVHF
jgi:hypothetical protein